MKKLITLAVLMLASCFAGAQTTNFTQGSNQFCTFQNYAFTPGVVTHRFSCGVIPVVANGVNTYQSFYVDLTPNSDNTGGNFTGQIILTSGTPYTDFSGTYVGSIDSATFASITSLHGDWVTGYVDSTFDSHLVGCGRSCTRTKRYLVSGSGIE